MGKKNCCTRKSSARLKLDYLIPDVSNVVLFLALPISARAPFNDFFSKDFVQRETAT